MAKQYKEVFAIIDNPNGNGKARWPRVGVAFVNQDDSLNVILDALPVGGRLQIRDPKPATDSSRS